MIADNGYGKATPLTWLGSFPVYLATAIAAGLGVSMILTAVLMAVGGPPTAPGSFLSTLVFSWETSALQGQLWQFVTYILVNPPGFWALIQLVMLGMFGSEVEKFLGRQQFLWLYVTLLLAGPLLLCVMGLLGIGTPLMGSGMVNFGVFLAFAFIYPKAEIFFGIQARWIALALVGIYTLMGLSVRDLTGVSLIWWMGIAAFVFLRWEGAALSVLPSLPEKSESTKPRKKPAPRKPRSPDLHESIDPILEKISRQGMSSLTKEEKTRLERARSALIDKEKPDA